MLSLTKFDRSVFNVLFVHVSQFYYKTKKKILFHVAGSEQLILLTVTAVDHPKSHVVLKLGKTY